MALFEYFPNYIWNLSVAIAMESGGRIGEIVDMCESIRKAAENGDAATPDFMRRWAGKGRELLELAAEDEAKGRAFSASNKLERASLYLFVAERMQAHGSEGRKETYALARDSFDRSTKLGRINRDFCPAAQDGRFGRDQVQQGPQAAPGFGQRVFLQPLRD